MTKVMKVTLLVVDHDDLGEQSVKDLIEATRFPSHCISPSVMDVEAVDIGEWHDSHPINLFTTRKREFERLFSNGKPEDEKSEAAKIVKWLRGLAYKNGSVRDKLRNEIASAIMSGAAR